MGLLRRLDQPRRATFHFAAAWRSRAVTGVSVAVPKGILGYEYPCGCPWAYS